MCGMRKAARQLSHTGYSGDTLRIYPAWNREHHIPLVSSSHHGINCTAQIDAICMRFNNFLPSISCLHCDLLNSLLPSLRQFTQPIHQSFLPPSLPRRKGGREGGGGRRREREKGREEGGRCIRSEICERYVRLLHFLQCSLPSDTTSSLHSFLLSLYSSPLSLFPLLPSSLSLPPSLSRLLSHQVECW